MEVSKAPPPLLGFNNNVRHRGRIFHIQTEDSGVRFPRIVTHLFADGGHIVKTARTDYSEHLSQPDMAAVVRGMMKEQHKAMFASLRAGELDVLLESVCGPLEPARAAPAPAASDPTRVSDRDTARVVVGDSTSPSMAPGSNPSLIPLSVAPSAALTQLTQPSPGPDASASESHYPAGDSEASLVGKRPLSNPNLRKPAPSASPPKTAAFDLDVASLDVNPPAKAPPPSPSARPPRKSSQPPPRKSRPPIPNRPEPPQRASGPAVAAASSEGSASAPSRPQARPAAAPPSNARSIFGDGVISEQSLDEVILSYLAEDLEEPK